MLNYKNIIFFYAPLLCLFVIPILIFGVADIEEHEGGLLSLRLFKENNFNFFNFYNDLLGPGTKLPLGNGLLAFPTFFLINNLKIYYLINILISFLILNYGLKKILNFFKIKEFYLLTFLYFFSISFFNYSYFNDWGLHPFVFSSLLPIIFYQALKYLKLKKSTSLFKLLIILIFAQYNGHPATILTLYIIIMLIFVINKKFFFLKDKFFYLASFFFIASISYDVFHFYDEIKNYKNINRLVQDGYLFKHLFSGFYLFLSFFETFSIFKFPYVDPYNTFDSRLPFSNIIIYISIYESIKQIIKKNSYNIYNLNIIFLLLLFLSFFPYTKQITYLSGVWQFRDYYNFISIILFSVFLKNLNKKKIYNFFVFLSIIFSLNFYLQNVKLINDVTKNSYNIIKINNNVIASDSYIFLNNIKNDEKFKTYLSPEVYRKIRKDKLLNELNIFSLSSLMNYRLYPFTFYFYTSAKNKFSKPLRKMHSEIKPNFKDINNPIFFNLFRIKFLLIYENELKFINLSKFKINRSLEIDNKKLLLLENINTNNVTINEEELNEINKIKCQEYHEIECILNNSKFFEINHQLKIIRKKTNSYSIKNENNKKPILAFIPFSYDKNWKAVQNTKIININNTLMIIKVNPMQTVDIYYQNKTRQNIKIFSTISFLFLLIYLCCFKINFFTKSKKLKFFFTK